MRFSKRAGAMLLAVGAGVLASQGSATAAPVGPDQVGVLEDALATRQVPVEVPLTPLGSRLSAGIPTSLVMPPAPDRTTSTSSELIPERIVPQLSTGKVGPSAKAELPLPLVDRGADLGGVLLDSPASPLHADTPGVSVGKPLSLAQDGAGQLADGKLKVGEVDPRLLTGAVQAVPGASASLGGEDHRLSVTDEVNDLTTTTAATATEVVGQTWPADPAATTGVVQQTGLTDLTRL